jgi:15-cis-phytoene synthase/lycopene beta-cyclase
VLYAPLCTRLDLYKIAFLITIAVASTIPWDSYLIRNSIWSYPENVVMGPKILDIPIEEVFFFVIQTFNTTLLYLLLSKPTLHSVYLVKEKKGSKWKVLKLGGQLVLGLVIKRSYDWIKTPGQYTYMGLILVWACPFLLLLWSLAYQLLVKLPFANTAIPIAIPTLYLWAVDSLALQRGTWVISSATKTGMYLPVFGLEAEEAVFFFLTNCLIVFGLVAFDNAIAVINVLPAHFPSVPSLPTPALLVRALLLPAAAYDDDRILGLRQSVQRLQNKSRSFYLASGTFSGRLRIDLIHLYSFCRIADDLIDNAQSPQEAKLWVLKLRKFLEFSYGEAKKSADGSLTQANDVNQGAATLFAMNNFPRDTHLSLMYLPTLFQRPQLHPDQDRARPRPVRFPRRRHSRAPLHPARPAPLPRPARVDGQARHGRRPRHGNRPAIHQHRPRPPRRRPERPLLRPDIMAEEGEDDARILPFRSPF